MTITIEVTPGTYHGTWWVTVNDDPEHVLTQACLGWPETLASLVEVIDELAERGDE